MKTYYINRRRFNILISLFISFILLLASGFRIGGYDYTNYVDMITFTQSADSVFGKIIIAKDPMFGLIVGLIDPTHVEEYWRVFLSIACLAFLGKLFFINQVYRCILFSIMYALLLAPGLDFAAIRALLGLIFLLSALSCISCKQHKLYYFFSFASVTSHISMLLPVLLSSKIINDRCNKNRISLCFFVFFISIFSKPVLKIFSNTGGYIEASGTIYAFFSPLLMLLALLLISYLIKSNTQTEFCYRTYNTSLLIAFMSLGFTFQVVVASYRFLQISQVLFLIVICSIRFKNNASNIILYSLTILCYAIPILYQNYSFDLWHSAWISIFSKAGLYE